MLKTVAAESFAVGVSINVEAVMAEVLAEARAASEESEQ